MPTPAAAVAMPTPAAAVAVPAPAAAVPMSTPPAAVPMPIPPTAVPVPATSTPIHEGEHRPRCLTKHGVRRAHSFGPLLRGLSKKDPGREGWQQDELSIHDFFLLWYPSPLGIWSPKSELRFRSITSARIRYDDTIHSVFSLMGDRLQDLAECSPLRYLHASRARCLGWRMQGSRQLKPLRGSALAPHKHERRSLSPLTKAMSLRESPGGSLMRASIIARAAMARLGSGLLRPTPDLRAKLNPSGMVRTRQTAKRRAAARNSAAVTRDKSRNRSASHLI